MPRWTMLRVRITTTVVLEQHHEQKNNWKTFRKELGMK